MPNLHALSSDALPPPLLHDEEREDDDVDVERRRLDGQAELLLAPEEAFRHHLLHRPRDLAAGLAVVKLHKTQLSW